MLGESSPNPKLDANARGQRLEAEVKEALGALKSRFPRLIGVDDHPEIALHSEEVLIPDFSLTVLLPFARLHYFLECQDRKKKDKDILHKIFYARSLQWRNTFIFGLQRWRFD